MFFRITRRANASPLAGFFFGSAALVLLATTGCGIGSLSVEPYASPALSGSPMTGILHGGPNPIIGATVNLYFTGTAYGTAANGGAPVATAKTGSSGGFTLPATSITCPAGSYAYLTAVGGSTGGTTANTASLLMVPIGLCSANYTGNAYTGGTSYWIDELTTTVSAYALSGFMTVGSDVQIGAPANNTGTSCAGLVSATATLTSGAVTAITLLAPNGCPYTTAPTVTFTAAPTGTGNSTATATATINSSGIVTGFTITNAGAGYGTTVPTITVASPPNPVQAAGLAHAFANAANLINVTTGTPNAYTLGGTGSSSGGLIPVAEINLLGNILQACVNSAGPTGTNTATSNDGTVCGGLFSFVTPPQSGAAVPSNTMQAMLDLAKYPSPSVNTWNTACTAAGSGTTTATTCLFDLAPTVGAYPNALLAAPPDWTMAVVYQAGYGSTGASNPGLAYPYYVATDYQDNLYVINWSASTPTYTNILGFKNSGLSIFTTAKDTTNLQLSVLATDTAGHAVATNIAAASGSPGIPVYSTSNGAVLTTATFDKSAPKSLAIDPGNDFFVSSGTTAGYNVRKFIYAGTAAMPTYTLISATAYTSTQVAYQMQFDSNLDLYIMSGGSSTTNVYFFNNNGTSPLAPNEVGSGSFLTSASESYIAPTGSSSGAAGIAVRSGNNATIIDSAGFIPLTKSGTTISAGTASAVTPVNSSAGLNNRYAIADGNNWIYSPDAANGTQTGAIDVFDTTDTLVLGPYYGCYVIAATSMCGTTTATSPIYSPRAIALDSSGDIWVVSGAGGTLTELVGAAAPTWPALSTVKFGLPQ
jgi:hypothetical protein